MKPVGRIEGRAYPLGRANIDTDVIIAAEHLKTTGRGAPILIAGDNFGCGSSREHAVWALGDLGIEAVIATGFSDIFASNAFKNGLLTIALPQEAIDRLLELAPDHPITADLETMTVTSPLQDRFEFSLDPFRRACLLAGLDEIALTLAHESAIAAHEALPDRLVLPRLG